MYSVLRGRHSFSWNSEEFNLFYLVAKYMIDKKKILVPILQEEIIMSYKYEVKMI